MHRWLFSGVVKALRFSLILKGPAWSHQGPSFTGRLVGTTRGVELTTTDTCARASLARTKASRKRRTYLGVLGRTTASAYAANSQADRAKKGFHYYDNADTDALDPLTKSKIYADLFFVHNVMT